ncbi:type III secretion system export apparatus subunit SctT [Rhizobacter sp. Root1221]|uniref:type III secretion system export apparatus subunit SctT n=1 Tax=Rhizobacter sp. Root1221 TaxID=1736433 RepID=UPI0006F61AF8|nr:type III secretion system export apparatus subunit SctT [Rhizobacter sp. Root1221]KQV99313.1 type III secretion system protein [Rhizobacter sp. Root1221]
MDFQMNDGAAALYELALNAKALLALVAVCTVRIYAAMLVLPATNDQLITGAVRNGMAVSFGVFVAYGQPVDLAANLNVMQLMSMVLKEAMVGMLIGFAMSTIFWIAEGVGMLIDNQAGFNNVQQTNPLTGQQSTPVGNLLAQLAISGFYMLGGMMVFVGLLFDSFQWWPLLGTMPDWLQLMERFLPGEVTSLAETTLKIAGPVLVTLVLIDLGIGLLGKAAEKLEPNSLGQPIKGATAMLMLVVLIAVFFSQVRPELSLKPLAARFERMAKSAQGH